MTRLEVVFGASRTARKATLASLAPATRIVRQTPKLAGWVLADVPTKSNEDPLLPSPVPAAKRSASSTMKTARLASRPPAPTARQSAQRGLEMLASKVARNKLISDRPRNPRASLTRRSNSLCVIQSAVRARRVSDHSAGPTVPRTRAPAWESSASTPARSAQRTSKPFTLRSRVRFATL